MTQVQNKNQKGKYEIDMCNGPLLKKILLFAIPLMLSGILQLLFNAADIVVVGRYAGSHSLAAVGSTSSLINLIINLFIGLSVGANVLVARYYGAKQDSEISETVHTAIVTAIIGGIILIFIGILLARPLLTLMKTPPEVLDQSVLYMRIYFIGMPVTLIFNYGSSILRAVGDTKRPLYFLVIAGIVNVILNLIFVINFKMGVAGVALATVIAQCISAYLIIRCLMKTEGSYQLTLSKLKIHKGKLIRMMQIGIPAGLQGSLFSISNVLIQSSVNSFGALAMAGNTAASNVEGFVYTSMNAMHQTALSFTGQNYGARKYKRINQILLICLGTVTGVGLILGNLAVLCSKELISIYSPDAEVIAFGMLRLSYICSAYFLCGLMDVMVGVLRGLGHSIVPMLVSLTGACGLRVLWIFTIFVSFRSLDILYLSYPITWLVTFLAHVICYMIIKKKLFKTQTERS